MADSEKNQALKQNIEELEKQAAGEWQEVATCIEKLKHPPEVKAFEDLQLPEQVLQTLSVKYSYLQHQHDTLLQKYALLLSAFTDVKSVTFEEYVSAEADKVAQNQIKAIREETKNKMEALQSKIGELPAEIASAKESNASLINDISTMLEDIEKLEARVRTLTTDAKKSSAKIQELETARDALDKALKERIQSMRVEAKELSEMQPQYNTEKKRLEDELCAFRKANEMLNENLQKEEEEEEVKRNEEEEKVRNSVQLRNNSTSVFTPITCTESVHKLIIKAGPCRYRFLLDINKNNILAVAYDYHSVYLYSETTKTEELLCTCQYNVQAIAWNQQGTLLAIGGEHMNDSNKTIQIWDFPSRKIIKILKMKEKNQSCRSLDWNGDIIAVGSNHYIYQWSINDRDNDQDNQGNKALLPRYTVRSRYRDWIYAVQWSNCKSKLATITINGYMCIYDKKFNLLHHIKAHNRNLLAVEWCPWDNQLIATCCIEGYLKIWRVLKTITLVKKGKLVSRIQNIKWIQSKNAIITADASNNLTLWEYPSLNILKIMKGHTSEPFCLALNANKTAIVSKSNEEIIFWKPFDELETQSESQEGTVTEDEEATEVDTIMDLDPNEVFIRRCYSNDSNDARIRECIEKIVDDLFKKSNHI